MPKRIPLRPKRWGGKVKVKVGRKWTEVKITLSTRRLMIQTGRARGERE